MTSARDSVYRKVMDEYRDEEFARNRKYVIAVRLVNYTLAKPRPSKRQLTISFPVKVPGVWKVNIQTSSSKNSSSSFTVMAFSCARRYSSNTFPSCHFVYLRDLTVLKELSKRFSTRNRLASCIPFRVEFQASLSHGERYVGPRLR